jgi:hypothetical protein
MAKANTYLLDRVEQVASRQDAVEQRQLLMSLDQRADIQQGAIENLALAQQVQAEQMMAAVADLKDSVETLKIAHEAVTATRNRMLGDQPSLEGLPALEDPDYLRHSLDIAGLLHPEPEQPRTRREDLFRPGESAEDALARRIKEVEEEARQKEATAARARVSGQAPQTGPRSFAPGSFSFGGIFGRGSSSSSAPNVQTMNRQQGYTQPGNEGNPSPWLGSGPGQVGGRRSGGLLGPLGL